MNTKTNVMIVSVFQKSVDEETNVKRHKELMLDLGRSGVPMKELLGRYEGSNELSILIQGFEHRETVERIARVFNQECYLESHNDRATFLVFPDGSKQSIGKLVNVSKEEAESSGSYSVDTRMGQYFVTKH